MRVKNQENNPCSVKKGFVFVLSMFLVGFSGCTGESRGQFIGGSMGALIGSQIGGGPGNIIATAIGAVAGVALGGALGKEFDKKDIAKCECAAQRAAASGQRIRWSNPVSHTYGMWEPGPVYYGPQHRRYRELKCIATKPNGKPVNVFVQAYQGEDGNWYMCQN